MLRARHAALGLWFGLFTACKADIPDGVFSCNEARDCPAHFVCRAGQADSDARYCYASDAASSNGSAGKPASDAGSKPMSDAGKPMSDAGPRAGTNADAGAPIDGGEDAGPLPVALAPAPTGFSTLRERRSGAGLTLYDDGFERGERLCSGDGRVCVTGGFEP